MNQEILNHETLNDETLNDGLTNNRFTNSEIDERDPLLDAIEVSLAYTKGTDASLGTILDAVLVRFDCVVGTIHTFDTAAGMLRLRAQRGIPEGIIDRVATIPVGKGMAGLAAERLAPVQVCNLQSDESGVAKPGAKETQMAGSISVPMMAGGRLRGTLGVAKPIEYEFGDEEIELLMRIGAIIGDHIGEEQ